MNIFYTVNEHLYNQAQNLTDYILKPYKGLFSNVNDPIDESSLDRSEFRLHGIACDVFVKAMFLMGEYSYYKPTCVYIGDIICDSKKLEIINAKLFELDNLHIDDTTYFAPIAKHSSDCQKQIYNNIKKYTETAQSIKKWIVLSNCFQYTAALCLQAGFISPDKTIILVGISELAHLFFTGCNIVHWKYSADELHRNNQNIARSVNYDYNFPGQRELA